MVRAVDDERSTGSPPSPRHAGWSRELELVSIVGVPLRAGGRALGAITLASDRGAGRSRAADIEVAEQLALQVSQVVDKAQRYEFEVRTSHTLQANLLPPPPPDVPGLSVAVRYLAATQGVEVGGDFYDVAQLAGGTCRSRSATWWGTTSPRRRRWGSCAACTGRCWSRAGAERR